MMYTVTNEIKKIAATKNTTEELIAQELGIKNINGCWVAENRSKENSVKRAVSEIQEVREVSDKYVCHECGYSWGKDWNARKVCPRCGETEMISLNRK